MNQSDALCGSCLPNGYALQGNSLWPSQQTGVGGVVWPAQPTQPPPCWYGQPDTPCWPGTQPIPAPGPATAPGPAPAPVPASAQAPAPVPALSPLPAPAPVQPCQQPCWPGPQYQPPQYQPPQPQLPQPQPPQPQPPQPQPPQYQPPQPQLPQPQPPQPQPSLPPAPALAPSTQPQVPRWPATPSWSYNPGQPGWPGQNPHLIPQQWPLPPTAGPMSVPYNLNLTRGVYDKMMMTIMGHVKPGARMFTINFLRGNDIAFHINPRFNEGGRQVLVRNHKVGERWGKEERDLKEVFPFAPGSPFEMKILCTSEEFRVKVNNMPLFEFKHRVRELNQIDRINILHDVVLTFINVETLP